MELTCLSKGGGFYYPPCHMLNVYGFQILLDYPLDLSALTIFSPIPTDSNAIFEEDSENEPNHLSLHSLGDGIEKGKKKEKPLNAKNLIHSEPYYKIVNSLCQWGSVDVVLISSPMGMLGLPFLTRAADFSAKIYVTEAAARIGQLMMEELVTVHMEHTQFYGSEESRFPERMKPEELEILPSALREKIMGRDGLDFGAWMALYSAADMKDCMEKIQTVKYAEETCYNGVLTLKALSSGLEIGACNWTITGPKGNFACLSSSMLASFHATIFDFKSLRGYDHILYSDISHDLTEEVYNGDVHSDAGKNSSATSDHLITELLLDNTENMEETEKIAYITSTALDSVNDGGSVLIPIGRLGIVLQLLENISSSLESSSLKVPMYFISSVAEEILAYSNIIPEWLCNERQEKLYSGQRLFAHVELIAEKKLHLFTDIYSDKLLNIWEEPCIVFCSHWSLRLGPVVHLLRRWSGDTRSLLVMESGIVTDLALLPFKPIAMRTLQCSFLSGMRLQKVQPLLRFLQPKCVLVPEDLRRYFDFPIMYSPSFIDYTENKSINVPTLKHISSKLEIATDLDYMHFNSVELQHEKIELWKLKGELVMEGNKHLLLENKQQQTLKKEEGNKQQLESSQRRHCSFLWGSVNLESLMEALQKMGMSASLEQGMLDTDLDHAIIHVLEPSNALIEIKGTSTVISAPVEKLSSLIFEAICVSLNGL